MYEVISAIPGLKGRIFRVKEVKGIQTTITTQQELTDIITKFEEEVSQYEGDDFQVAALTTWMRLDPLYWATKTPEETSVQVVHNFALPNRTYGQTEPSFHERYIHVTAQTENLEFVHYLHQLQHPLYAFEQEISVYSPPDFKLWLKAKEFPRKSDVTRTDYIDGQLHITLNFASKYNLPVNIHKKIEHDPTLFEIKQRQQMVFITYQKVTQKSDYRTIVSKILGLAEEAIGKVNPDISVSTILSLPKD